MAYILPGDKKVCRETFLSVYKLPDRKFRLVAEKLKEHKVDEVDEFCKEVNINTVRTYDDEHIHPFSHNELRDILFENLDEGIIKVFLSR